jgi:hypothetical protein
VFLLAVEVLDRETVERQRRIGVHPAAHRFERDLQQLGAEPRLRLLPAREQDLHLLAPRVDRVVALILVVLQRRVVPHSVRELAERLGQAERVEQLRGALSKRPFQRGVLADPAVELLVRLLPTRSSW